MESFVQNVRKNKTCKMYIEICDYAKYKGTLLERGWTNERLGKIIDASCKTDAILELTIDSAEIEEGFIRYFLYRLPEMKVKRLTLRATSVERLHLASDFWRALCSNYCIESLNIYRSGGHLAFQEKLFKCLNIVGRQRLKVGHFDPKLWPLLLERANTRIKGSYLSPSSILFHFVRNGGLIQTLSERETPRAILS